MTFLFKLFNGSLTLSYLAKIVEFSIATIAMILTLFYINFLSHDVNENLQELKNCIADINSGLTGNFSPAYGNLTSKEVFQKVEKNP